MSKYAAEQVISALVESIGSNPTTSISSKDVCILAALLQAKPEWPSGAILPEKKNPDLIHREWANGWNECLVAVRAALQSVRSPGIDVEQERCIAFRAGARWADANPDDDRSPRVMQISRESNLFAEHPCPWTEWKEPAKPDAGAVSIFGLIAAVRQIPVRRELISGQILTYVQLDEVIGTIEDFASRHARQVPDGWALVPINATENMRQEGAPHIGYEPEEAYVLDDAWEAMLDAAPPAPEKD